MLQGKLLIFEITNACLHHPESAPHLTKIQKYQKILMINAPSTLVYVKLLLLWALVLATDYLLEFRFEYLW